MTAYPGLTQDANSCTIYDNSVRQSVRRDVNVADVVRVVRRVPPHFSMAPDSVEVLPGGSVNLTCVAVGSPMPSIRWRLGAVELTPELEAPLGRNVLVLNDVRQTATYTCVASSELGSIEHQAEVQVKGTLNDGCHDICQPRGTSRLEGGG